MSAIPPQAPPLVTPMTEADWDAAIQAVNEDMGRGNVANNRIDNSIRTVVNDFLNRGRVITARELTNRVFRSPGPAATPSPMVVDEKKDEKKMDVD